MRRSCADANMAYSLSQHVFILECYSPSKSFAVFREAFSCLYSNNEAPNETRARRLITKLQDTGSVCVTSDNIAIEQLKLLPFRFNAVYQLQQWNTVATNLYSCCFCPFIHEQLYGLRLIYMKHSVQTLDRWLKASRTTPSSLLWISSVI
jgi:hypothetical protein